MGNHVPSQLLRDFSTTFEWFFEKPPLHFYWEIRCWTYYLHCSFLKHVPSQVLKDFSVENLETTPENFLWKFPSGIYFSQVFNCDSISTIYPQRGRRLVLFVFSPYFFPFLLVVSLTNTNIKKLGNIRKVSKLPKMIAWCPTSLRQWNFWQYWQRALGKQILNFSRCVLIAMKNRVSLRYFVSYCKLVVI